MVVILFPKKFHFFSFLRCLLHTWLFLPMMFHWLTVYLQQRKYLQIYINLLYLQFTLEGCGVTKGCYASPASCTTSENCDFLVTYNATKSLSRVDFELSGKGDWIALGFSDDQLMVSCNVSRMHLYIFLILLSPWTSRDVTLGRYVWILSYLHAYERIMKKFNRQMLTNLYQGGHFTVMNGRGWHFLIQKKSTSFNLTFTRRLLAK